MLNFHAIPINCCPFPVLGHHHLLVKLFVVINFVRMRMYICFRVCVWLVLLIEISFCVGVFLVTSDKCIIKCKY